MLWAVVVSLKSETEVLAYPPRLIFEPTLRNYRDALTGNLSIASSLVTSFVLATATTVLTILLAVPAAYAFARLRLPASQGLGFYTLVTQMIPPVGLVIPYFLILNRDRLARHLSGHDHRLPDLLAALRDLADGLLPGGHPARDGGGGLPRQGEPPAGALARHPAAGARRHRRHRRSSCSSTPGTSSSSPSSSAATMSGPSPSPCTISSRSSRRSGPSSPPPR